MIKRKTNKHSGIIEALHQAQKIAFSPFIFQACVAAKRLGVLAAMTEPASESDIEHKTGLSAYAVAVLVDALVASDLCRRTENGALQLTKTGECLLFDEMTSVNLDFAADVCYGALESLEESLKTARPEGLKRFGSWSTIYPGLSKLPQRARRSWFAFDHYYSDRYVDSLAALIEKTLHPRVLLDIGSNPGKFALAMLKASETARVVLIDLPQQCSLAKENKALHPYADRFSCAPVNWLEQQAAPQIEPKGDVIWMSQFLDCFSPEQAVSILLRAKALLAQKGRFAVLECLTDQQSYPAAQLSLAASSLYFTAIANGNSRFYRRAELMAIFDAAGLDIEFEKSNIGVSHTLFVCKPR